MCVNFFPIYGSKIFPHYDSKDRSPRYTTRWRELPVCR
ncbi:MAG: DUF4113 domain-containing protein [Brasilonema angustatum HA4187-MV1]|nr:DUF4113 domain-containing protein [Brasilonema angustatum HA4187-MV1]